ncbi:hypothetical protein BCT93_23000 [Vibrio lentus]|uniref:restriction endonuclease subunit S n=1 Tax=Vibrio TaxID=662 RepID=UPI000C84472C|nr:restriction endonuclease subunit S [Vibrio lentus]PMK67111.1 hypothetical protein BCT93_23000 [Vibrio lentus]
MKLVTLDSVLTFHRGITFKPDDKVEVGSDDSVVCLRTKNIQKELDERDLLAVPTIFVKRDELYVNQGDILISTANSWELVGKCVRVVKTQYKSTIGGFISMLRPKTGLIDPDYLFRFLSMDVTQDRIRHLGKKTTNISNLDRVRFLQLQIPLPPLETQKQIAAVLEKADQLRKDCKQMEQELNSLAQSVFIDMFGDPVTNPKSWEVSTLDAIASVQLGKMLSSKSKQNVNPKKYLRNANIQWREVGIDDLLEMDFNEKEMKKFRLQRGDLLVCEGGEIGRCAIWNEQVQDCYYQKALHRVRIDPQFLTSEYLQEYFFWMAKLGGLVNSTNEVTFKHLTAEKMNKLKVPLAPISKQKEFSAIYTSIRSELNNNVELMKEADATFSALMQKAFKGELNL